jgi:AAT family amino acid transporter
MSDLPEFQRGLKQRHLNLIALGGCIGSAYFLGSGYLLREVGPGSFIAYALGGLITYMTMMCLAELSVAVPGTGSFVRYAARFVSPTWACGVGWSYWLNWVIYIPSECLAAGIIMNSMFPVLSEFVWAMFFGLLFTGINLVHVGAFGEVEFWLSIVKVVALVGFSLLAVLIGFGWIGEPPSTEGFSLLWSDGGLFPNGVWMLAVNMVMLLVNFQGSEIIGLSAAESHDAEKAVPRAFRTTIWRTMGLFVVPIMLAAALLPWREGNLHEVIFAQALGVHGLGWAAQVFTFVVLCAALSCANSGMYGTVRSLHALACNGMAPRYFARLNKQRVPARATIATILGIWVMLGVSNFFSASTLYQNLLAMSGFTGTICWISICWSQLRFRRELVREVGSADFLKVKTPFFPYFTHAGIWLQVACLGLVAFSSELRASFFFGVPAIILPMAIYWWMQRRVPHLVEPQDALPEAVVPPKS